MFVDVARVHLRSGDGGAGVVAFVKSRGRLRGKPVGGSGGAGGDVVIAADDSVSTLLDYQRRPHRRAGSGTHGSGELRHGSRGEDLVLLVPPGTVVRDSDGIVLADLTRPDQRVVVLEGGRGGMGNAALAGRRRLAPGFAEQGEFGASADFTLELKLVADAALIGFPNAGKSTLISTVSAARPKVADYPFTTITPNLGVVEAGTRRFVLADIPGLIEGASEGKGLGLQFLRHAERSRVLVFLLDPSPLQEIDCRDQFDILSRELGRHDPDLAARPSLVAVGKADLPEAEQARELVAASGETPFLVSGVTGRGLDSLMHAVADLVEADGSSGEPGDGGFVLHRPGRVDFEVRRQGKRWVVSGRRAERAVAFDDLTDPEAADLAARRLARAGVDDELRRLGARSGDEVQIGDIVFEFSDDAFE